MQVQARVGYSLTEATRLCCLRQSKTCGTVLLTSLDPEAYMVDDEIIVTRRVSTPPEAKLICRERRLPEQNGRRRVMSACVYIGATETGSD